MTGVLSDISFVIYPVSSIDFNTSVGWILAEVPEFTRLELHSNLDDSVSSYSSSLL